MNENLRVLLNLMIPADPIRGLPGGAEVFQEPDDVLLLEERALIASDQIAEVVGASTGKPIAEMSPTDFGQFVKDHRHLVEPSMRVVGSTLLKRYYTHSSVQDAVGGVSRAPFPVGFRMPENNLDLLEVVYNRGTIYREVPGEG
jgi:hypothetical protein